MDSVTKQQMIISVISIILGSSVLNGIITHILYSRKLKKEQIARSENVVWDKIAEALECIRIIELKLRSQEIFNAEKCLTTKEEENSEDVNIAKSQIVYLEVMNDSKTFFDFFVEINEARETYGRYLDAEVGAYLYYMQNYCMRLMKYINNNGLKDDYPTAGIVFSCDLQKWQRAFEKLLVKRINSPKHKIYVEDGFWWEYKKRKMDRKFWKKSVLYKLINKQNDSTKQVK